MRLRGRPFLMSLRNITTSILVIDFLPTFGMAEADLKIALVVTSAFVPIRWVKFGVSDSIFPGLSQGTENLA